MRSIHRQLVIGWGRSIRRLTGVCMGAMNIGEGPQRFRYACGSGRRGGGEGEYMVCLPIWGCWVKAWGQVIE